jgi:hypothetical protein
MGFASMRSYSAITCAPKRSSVAASSRESRTTIDAVSDPYTTFTCESVRRYHTRMCRVISQRIAAVTPPMSACESLRRPTGITR